MGENLAEAPIGRYHRDGFVYPIGLFRALGFLRSALRRSRTS